MTDATRYTVGYSDIRRLQRTARAHGASEAELAAIDRLETFTAEAPDVHRLRPLAQLAGVTLPALPEGNG